MKRLLMALSIAALGLAYSGTAEAFTQTATGSMNLSATLVAACTVTTAPLAFGTYDNVSNLAASSNITVNCSNGVPYRIDIDAGQNIFVPGSFRRLKTGTAPADYPNTLAYRLSRTSVLGNNDWGDNGATYCTTCTTLVTGKSGTGIGVDEIHTVYGVLLKSSLVSTLGSFTDTVTVTVNY